LRHEGSSSKSREHDCPRTSSQPRGTVKRCSTKLVKRAATCSVKYDIKENIKNVVKHETQTIQTRSVDPSDPQHTIDSHYESSTYMSYQISKGSLKMDMILKPLQKIIPQ
jgi:hypothetical protein